MAARIWMRVAVGECLITGAPTLVDVTERCPGLIGGRGTEALRLIVGEHSRIAIEGERHRIHRSIFVPMLVDRDATARARGESIAAQQAGHEGGLASPT